MDFSMSRDLRRGALGEVLVGLYLRGASTWGFSDFQSPQWHRMEFT